MGPDDVLLVGTELVKEPARLVRAYDDAQGVTAEFNRNVLHVLRPGSAPTRSGGVRARRRGGTRAGVDRDATAGKGSADRAHARPRSDVRRRRELCTEISAKFRRERVAQELAEAGLRLERWETDASGDYALSLARPT
jgi:L-histidine N-alpha-methyltransferase